MKTSPLRLMSIAGLTALLCAVPFNIHAQSSKAGIGGTITAIDLDARTVTVDSPAGAVTFAVPAQCKCFTKAKQGAATLEDFQVGFRVSVAFTDDSSTHVAKIMAEAGWRQARP